MLSQDHCAHCLCKKDSAEPLVRCSCQAVSYCNKDCQKADWKHHKPACPPFREFEVAGKGKGLKATRRIPRYSVILEEDPVLVRDQNNNAAADEKLWEDFENLSLTEETVSNQQIQDVLKLFDPQASKDDSSVSDKLMRIMGVNSIKLTNRVTNKTSQNLYLRISRINHSCRPNSVWKPDVHSSRCAVVSLATIEKNEEITVNYHFNLTDPRGQFCLSYQQRQLKLNSLYSFSCLCQLCQQVSLLPTRLLWLSIFNLYFTGRGGRYPAIRICQNRSPFGRDTFYRR